MRSSLTTAAPATGLEQLHPSLALRARLGSASVSGGTAALLVDLGMLFLAVTATELGARAGGSASPSVLATIAFVALAVGFFHARCLYAPRLVPDTLEDAKTIAVQVSAAAMAILAVLLVGNLGSPEEITAGGVVRLWGFAAVYVVAGRVALGWSQAQARRSGDAVSPTFVVGTGPVARLAARRLLEHRELGLLPVIARCEQAGISVAFIPGSHERFGRNIRVEHIGALPLITAHATDPKGWQFALKYALDRIVAGLLLLALAPILLACAAAVYLSMGRPIFFRQPRVGVDGEEIGVLKFRSMRLAPVQAASFVPAAGTAPGGVEGEDRRTPVGTFLRKTSLDELPQLINVLLGEMSLVGPRPERPEYVEQFTHSVRRYGERHRVRAGITGWAQVHGLRGQTSIADRAEWDNWYIENFSLWLDVKILVLTVVAVLRYARQGE